MEVKDLIYSRHSVRNFKDQDIPNEDILKIIDAARMGPSPENAQNWHFLVIRNKDFMNKLKDLILKKSGIIISELEKVDENRAKRFWKFTNYFTVFFVNAPVLIMVYTYTVPPAAYIEYQLIGKSQEELEHLLLQNPGLQGLGASLEHSVLTLMDMGYGTCLMTAQNWCHREIEELVKQELGFDKGKEWFLGTMMPVGIPEGPLKSPGRRPLEDMVEFFD